MVCLQDGQAKMTGVSVKFQVSQYSGTLGYLQSTLCPLYLNGFLLVYSKAVHQTQNLFIKLPNGWLIFLPLWIKGSSLDRNFYEHPFVLLDLSYGKPFGWVQDQHPSNEVLTIYGKHVTKVM